VREATLLLVLNLASRRFFDLQILRFFPSSKPTFVNSSSPILNPTAAAPVSRKELLGATLV